MRNVNIFVMAYAVSIGAVAAFLIVYILLQRRVKPVYCKNLSDVEFEAKAKEFVHSMPLPKKSAEVPSLAFSIKRNIYRLRSIRYGRKFDDLLISKDKLKDIYSTTCSFQRISLKIYARRRV